MRVCPSASPAVLQKTLPNLRQASEIAASVALVAFAYYTSFPSLCLGIAAAIFNATAAANVIEFIGKGSLTNPYCSLLDDALTGSVFFGALLLSTTLETRLLYSLFSTVVGYIVPISLYSEARMYL